VEVVPEREATSTNFHQPPLTSTNQFIPQ